MLNLRGVIDRPNTVPTVQVDNVTALRQLDPPSNTPDSQFFAQLKSGSFYYWQPDSTATHNGGTVVQPINSVSTGRWLKFNSSTVATADIAADAVTNAKLADMAANTIKANATGSTDNPADLAIAANKFPARSSTGQLAAKDITDFGLSLVDDATASDARTTLGLAYASQAEMETGTATDRVVSPGRLANHPGAAKAWVMFTVSGTTVTVQASYNVTSVTRGGTGLYTVNFTTAFSSANYAFMGSAGNTGIGAIRQSSGGTLAASFTLEVLNNTGSALADPAICSMVFFGDQ